MPIQLLSSNRLVDSGGDIQYSRPDFRVYAQITRPSGGPLLDEAGYLHYKNRGLGLLWNFYNNGGYVTQSGVNLYVDSAFGGPAGPHIDLWFHDNEFSGYTWDVSGAALCIADMTNVYDWAQTRLALRGALYNPAYLGAYTGGAAGITIGPGGWGSYVYQLYNPTTYANVIADNDACGYYVNQIWDFAVPEHYTSKLDEYAGTLERYASEKRRMGATIKLFPLIWPTYPGWTTSMSYELITSFLEYSIRVPEAAPTYHDNEPYMMAILDFIDKYGLSLGTPF